MIAEILDLSGKKASGVFGTHSPEDAPDPAVVGAIAAYRGALCSPPPSPRDWGFTARIAELTLEGPLEAQLPQTLASNPSRPAEEALPSRIGGRPSGDGGTTSSGRGGRVAIRVENGGPLCMEKQIDIVL